ncbi:MAG: ATP-binding cassette domain-containing protein [Coriobacteriia bacterium]|nr:ATP-binding cassette domain-containing protein [Coriobacteriia bacterium]
MSAIITEGLTKRFGDLVAVNRLNLDIPEGGVVGFVGPNGSGKSTTIRMLLGLINPSAGSGEVLGAPISKPAAYAHRVGALIESPSFVPSLSARANLRSLAALRGLPTTRVAEVVDTVGLSGRERDLVKTYSLGMKQRLAIAAALLPDPELLILDEPTNGLDPAGIVEVRILLQELGAQGRTLLVSSHLLSEIEAACSQVVIIRFGEMLFSGPLAELMVRTTAHVKVAPEHEPDAVRLAELYAARGWGFRQANGDLVVEARASDAPELNRVAALGGITLRKLSAYEDTLEDVFLEMTGATDGDNALFRSRQRAKRQPLFSQHASVTDKEVDDA